MLLRLLAAVVLLASPAAANVRATQAALPLEGGPDPYAIPVARTVASIIEYSRWPQDHPSIRLCMAGPAEHAERIAERPLTRSRAFMPLAIDTPAESLGQCDVLYIGRMGLDDQRRFTDAARDKPVLTIAENDPACRSQAMVCLLFEANGVSFRINIDAISRSHVRIDPRVLRLSVQGGAP
ncbi:MAG: YfiR family protein [Altererythrobacter sp.]|nr:YfiR family protein [Altererythrobacter sp.]OJU59092.1 MAG: hypothetical protein BGO08_05350 [Altererythrobacter sp. 66-12]